MVSSGRLDFVNGGWSNNDETCSSFENTLTNFMKGHSFLAAEFGIRPKIGWVKGTIDHSAGFTRLMSDLGLHSMIYSKMSE
jgi:hypothetical protein